MNQKAYDPEESLGRGERSTPCNYVIFLPLATQEGTLTDKENETVLKHLCALLTLC